jgi:GntR family transcriptional regulator
MELRVDPRSPLPLKAQVERLLRGLIDLPEHRAGAKLPDEIGLAERLGVSRNTVRSAIERLVQEGLLERRRGVGTHVARPRVAAHEAAWDAFVDELEPRGDGVTVITAKAAMAACDAEAAAALGLAAATQALRLERVLADESGPLARIRSWLHPRLVLSASEDFRQPLFATIERVAGAIPTLAHEALSAGLADPETLRLLQLRRGSAVLARRRIVCDAQRRPIELGLAWYRPDHQRQLELRRDPRR